MRIRCRVTATALAAPYDGCYTARPVSLVDARCLAGAGTCAAALAMSRQAAHALPPPHCLNGERGRPWRSRVIGRPSARASSPLSSSDLWQRGWCGCDCGGATGVRVRCTMDPRAKPEDDIGGVHVSSGGPERAHPLRCHSGPCARDPLSKVRMAPPSVLRLPPHSSIATTSR